MNFWKRSGESRYPGALSPVMKTPDPTDCPWVSEDEDSVDMEKISVELWDFALWKSGMFACQNNYNVSGTVMSILLFFRTVINSLRFKVVEPSVLFWASGFCHLHPSSLARMEGPCAFVRWRRCVMAPVFSSEIFVKVYLSLQRTVSMFRTAENEQQRMYERCEI